MPREEGSHEKKLMVKWAGFSRKLVDGHPHEARRAVSVVDYPVPATRGFYSKPPMRQPRGNLPQMISLGESI